MSIYIHCVLITVYVVDKVEIKSLQGSAVVASSRSVRLQEIMRIGQVVYRGV